MAITHSACAARSMERPPSSIAISAIVAMLVSRAAVIAGSMA
jgi:hypothetical protein